MAHPSFFVFVSHHPHLVNPRSVTTDGSTIKTNVVDCFVRRLRLISWEGFGVSVFQHRNMQNMLTRASGAVEASVTVSLSMLRSLSHTTVGREASVSQLSPTLASNEMVARKRNAGQRVFHFGFGQSPFPVSAWKLKAQYGMCPSVRRPDSLLCAACVQIHFAVACI